VYDRRRDLERHCTSIFNLPSLRAVSNSQAHDAIMPQAPELVFAVEPRGRLGLLATVNHPTWYSSVFSELTRDQAESSLNNDHHSVTD